MPGDSKPVSLEGKKSPYDQFLGATQRRADSHRTADEACEQNTVIGNVSFPLKRHICEKIFLNTVAAKPLY